MRSLQAHLVVPGPLNQRTGGYLYDARMARGLRARGWSVEVHELDGTFPDPDEAARQALETALSGCPDGGRVVVDGLALGGLPEAAEGHGPRLRLLGLVHHPLAEETGLDPELRRRFRDSEARALAACHGVVVTSRYTAERVESLGVPAKRIRAVVPGTDPADPVRGPDPGAPPRLVCVASVTPRKGHDVLVEALQRIRHLPWSCLLAGSLDRAPAFVETVRARIRDADLGNRIRFAGEREADALDRIYDEGSLFVLASHYEGYGMALTEALARGLPVVSTTGGAIPWTVPESAGVLVPPGDPEALAGALAPLLDPVDGLRRRALLAAAAREHAATLPTWPEAADTFQRALLELAPVPAEPAAGAGPAPGPRTDAG